MVVGATNTGKSTLCCKIIKRKLDRKEVDQLVVISPNFRLDEQLVALASRASELGVTVRVYENFTQQSIAKFVDYMSKCAARGVNSVVYIDDPVGLKCFSTNVNTQSPFNSFVAGLKHYKTTMIFSSQSIGAMSKSARKNVEVFIFLPDMITRDESYAACRFVPSFDQFNALMDRYASKEHCALWVNVQFGKRGVYHINAAGAISPITRVPK